MSNHIFTGSGVALITPMKSDGSVNYDVLGDLVEFHVQNGTDAIIVCGTTGEAATLSEKEHCETISFVAEKTNGRIPVIAGTGSNDTSTAVMLSKSAASTGVDALLCVTPYYNKTSQQGLVRHFNVVADSVDIPIILYNVPSRTGCNIKPKTYQELCKHPNIVAAKEASGDISQNLILLHIGNRTHHVQIFKACILTDVVICIILTKCQRNIFQIRAAAPCVLLLSVFLLQCGDVFLRSLQLLFVLLPDFIDRNLFDLGSVILIITAVLISTVNRHLSTPAFLSHTHMRVLLPYISA